MRALTKNQAVEKLAEVVENAKATALPEISSELFPETPTAAVLSAADLARHVRSGLEAEEIVDLWNVLFPADRNVWYDEEEEKVRYNEESLGYVEAD
jgi:hypothetical protein